MQQRLDEARDRLKRRDDAKQKLDAATVTLNSAREASETLQSRLAWLRQNLGPVGSLSSSGADTFLDDRETKEAISTIARMARNTLDGTVAKAERTQVVVEAASVQLARLQGEYDKILAEGGRHLEVEIETIEDRVALEKGRMDLEVLVSRYSSRL